MKFLVNVGCCVSFGVLFDDSSSSTFSDEGEVLDGILGVEKVLSAAFSSLTVGGSESTTGSGSGLDSPTGGQSDITEVVADRDTDSEMEETRTLGSTV